MYIKLEQYFDSEESWLEFSKLFEEFWYDSDFQIDLLELCNKKKDIAVVIYYHMRDNYKKWLNSKVHAFDDLKPIECFNDEILIKRLKVCLRKMPYQIEKKDNHKMFVFNRPIKTFEEIEKIIEDNIKPDFKSEIEITSWTSAFVFSKRGIKIYFENFYFGDDYFLLSNFIQ